MEEGTYYLDEQGLKTTGWKTIEGKKYYFQEDGLMYQKTILKLSDKLYYISEIWKFIYKSRLAGKVTRLTTM